MSFSGDVKEELSRSVGGARHCMMAELAAILAMCGKVYISAEEQYAIRMQTENVRVARKYGLLLKKLFHLVPEISVRRRSGQTVNALYKIFLRDSRQAENVLQAVKLLNPDGSLAEEVPLVHQPLVQNICCRRAYLRGAFLAAGSISDPNKAYHFEIVCNSEYHAAELTELICSMNIDAKRVQRKKYLVVYVKDGCQIVDLLAMMDATKALLELENIRIVKEMRGSVNRKVNCETANISKTINAAMKQVEEIQYIEKTRGLSCLPNGLDEVARLRVQYPSATLKELGEMLDPPVGKSGINHRLRKIGEIAEALRQGI